MSRTYIREKERVSPLREDSTAIAKSAFVLIIALSLVTLTVSFRPYRFLRSFTHELFIR